MSLVQLGKRSMRIIALPLTTASTSPKQERLIYYHFVTPPPKDDRGKDWSRWLGVKAAEIWAGFGRAPEGNWKVSNSSPWTWYLCTESPVTWTQPAYMPIWYDL